MRKQITPSGSSKGTSRNVSVELGEFAYQALGGEEEKGAALVSSRLPRVIEAYLADRDRGRPSWAYPAHLQEQEGRRSIPVELEIGVRSFDELTEEARQRGVSFEQLVGHAALYYLAEVDAGRMTQRILDDLGEPEEE